MAENALNQKRDPRGEMQAQRRVGLKNNLLGWAGDFLAGGERPDPSMPMGVANPVLNLLDYVMPIKSAAKTLDRMSYGEPLNNARQANVPWLKPETADALMMAPLSPRNALAAASMGMGVADNGAMRAAYLAHTPLKPNNLVGTRYEREFAGGLADKTPRTIEDLKGSNLVLMPWDSTSRNFKVTSISGERLPTPVMTTGGQDFARDVAHVSNDIGGASNFEIARRIQTRNRNAAIENQQAGGSGSVYMMPTTMGAQAENFSTMPAEALMQLVKNANLSKKDIKYLDQQIRNEPMVLNKKLVRPFGGFLGLNDADVAQQLLTGARIDTTAGNLRKGLSQALTKVGNQKMIGFNAEDLSESLMDDALRGVGKGHAGNTLINAVNGTPLSASTHPAYDTDFGGKYFGSLMNNIPAEILMPKTFGRISNEFASRGSGVRNMTLGAMEKRNTNVSEYVDAQVIDSVNQWLKGLRR